MDPIRNIAQKAYKEYATSSRNKFLRDKYYTCPICCSTFKYLQLEYHANTKKHRKKLAIFRDKEKIKKLI
jgi:hypothetical protein